MLFRSVGVSAAQAIEERCSTHLWTGIALMTSQSVAIAVAVRIPPLSWFMGEGITQIGPSISVGVLAAPTVASCRRANRSTGDIGANICSGHSWVIASAIAICVVPLRGVLRPSITATTRAGKPIRCWV